MTVYDGETIMDPIIGIFCGEMSVPAVFSTGSALLVEFRSFAGLSPWHYTGFQARARYKSTGRCFQARAGYKSTGRCSQTYICQKIKILACMCNNYAKVPQRVSSRSRLLVYAR